MGSEEEVDHILDEWWNGSNQMRRRLWLPVLLVVCILAIGPNEGRMTQALFIVAPLLLAWWGWPELRTVLHRRRRKLSVVLWIRRFHRGSQSRQLLRVWEVSAALWGQVVTMSDEIIRRPLTMLPFIALLVIAIPILFLLALLPSHLGGKALLHMFLSMILLGIILGSAMALVSIKRATTVIKDIGQIEKIFRQIRRIQAERLFLWSGASRILRCPTEDNELWRTVIQELAPAVDVVILDCAGGLSDSLEWELRTLLTICSPEKIIIATPQDTLPEGRQISLRDLSETLPAILGTQLVPQIVAYPLKIPWTRFAFQKLRPIQRAVGIAALTPHKKELHPLPSIKKDG